MDFTVETKENPDTKRVDVRVHFSNGSEYENSVAYSPVDTTMMEK
jgi:hypothetical protein